MKIIMIIGIITSFLYSEIWRDEYVLSLGFNKKVVCKNGYLMSIITKKDGNTTQIIEQQYCYDISGWDGSCNHPPIKCKKEKQ
jgi:hypothetical protein